MLCFDTIYPSTCAPIQPMPALNDGRTTSYTTAFSASTQATEATNAIHRLRIGCFCCNTHLQACAWYLQTRWCQLLLRTPFPSQATLKAAGSTTHHGLLMAHTSHSLHAAQVCCCSRCHAGSSIGFTAFSWLPGYLLSLCVCWTPPACCLQLQASCAVHPALGLAVQCQCAQGLQDFSNNTPCSCGSTCMLPARAMQEGLVTHPVGPCSCGLPTRQPARLIRCWAQGA